MVLYRQEVIEYILGITIYEYDWYLGLYVLGTNPYVNLATAEADGMRVLIEGSFGWSNGTMTNTLPITTGTTDTAITAEGWFLVNGFSTDILFSHAFFTPIDVDAGNSAYFPAERIFLDFTV